MIMSSWICWILFRWSCFTLVLARVLFMRLMISRVLFPKMFLDIYLRVNWQKNSACLKLHLKSSGANSFGTSCSQRYHLIKSEKDHEISDRIKFHHDVCLNNSCPFIEFVSVSFKTRINEVWHYSQLSASITFVNFKINFEMVWWPTKLCGTHLFSWLLSE